MDINSILPLLMQNSNTKGDTSSQMQMIMNMMNMNSSQNSSVNSTQNNNIHNTNQSGNDNNASQTSNTNELLMNMLAGKNGGQNNNMALINMLTSMNGKQKKAPPQGLKPVKSFIPDEILGKVIKYFEK